MAKNKGKFGKGKSDVVLEDEFISWIERVAEDLKPYAARILIVLGTVLLAGIGWAVYRWHANGQSEEATAAYARALAVLDARVSPQPPAGDGDKKDPAAAPSDDEAPVFATDEARRKAAIEALSGVRSDFGSTDVADQVRLVEASELYAQGRSDDAAKLYDAYASGAPSGLAVIGREGHALALESKALAAKNDADKKAGLEQALAAFEAMQPKKSGPLYARARYHQARILAALGKKTDAAARYREALTGLEGMPLAATIQMALDELGVPAPEKATAPATGKEGATGSAEAKAGSAKAVAGSAKAKAADGKP
ncbi:MAG TPA: tetratricopeptide repeat protein [Kofleriaceae bacterium]|nr:tetratricopeptide repeat protein [Kofleriaceae bacterium]